MSIPTRWRRRVYLNCSWIALLLGMFWTYRAIRLYYPSNVKGFSVHMIRSQDAYRPDWEVHALSALERTEVLAALSQPYHYLACGNQAFAFESEDGQYVLKFLKQKLFKTLRFWDAKERWKKRNKQERDFASYRIAFDQLQEETGLVWVHLNPTDWLPSLLMVTDDRHATHQINLNEVHFILQRKAELVYPALDALMSQGRLEEAKAALISLQNLLIARAGKGITDGDPDLDKNFGFLHGKAIQIDIGRFADRPYPQRYRDRDKKMGEKWISVPLPPLKPTLADWLAQHHPTLLNHWERSVNLFLEDGQLILREPELIIGQTE